MKLNAIYYNVYGWNAKMPVKPRQKMQIDLVKKYSPDFIGFQEFSNFYYRPTFTEMMASAGYTEVPSGKYEAQTGEQAHNYTPLFFNEKKLSLIDSGDYYFTSPDNDVESKSVTWALFETTDKKRFIAMSVHFHYQKDDKGRKAREENAHEIIALINGLKEKHQCPVIFGGDLNCELHESPHSILKENGLCNLNEYAKVKDNCIGKHPFAIFEGDVCKEYFTPQKEYEYSIDHGYFCGNMEIENFKMITDTEALICSDHCPFTVDFEVL